MDYNDLPQLLALGRIETKGFLMAANEVIWTPEFVESHDYYSGQDDDEYLDLTNLFEAVEQHLAQLFNDPIEQMISEGRSVTIYGFARLLVGKESVEKRIDAVIEWLCEEYGDPEDDCATPAEVEAARIAFVDAVVANYRVYRCDPVVKIIVPLAAYWASLSEQDKELLRG